MPRKTLLTRFTAAVATFTLLASVCISPAAAASKLQVMTATTDLAALAQEIGGDRVDVESVAKILPRFVIRYRCLYPDSDTAIADAP